MKAKLIEVSEHYAMFTFDGKCACICLDRLPQIRDGVYKVEVFSNFYLVDINEPLPHGGKILEAI